MGSDSDLPTMEPAAAILRQLGVEVEVRVLSAHRTPLEMVDFAQRARDQGFGVIVAGCHTSSIDASSSGFQPSSSRTSFGRSQPGEEFVPSAAL